MTNLLRNNQVTGITLYMEWTARKVDPGRPGSLLPAVLAPSLPPAGPPPKIRRKGTAPPPTHEGSIPSGSPPPPDDAPGNDGLRVSLGPYRGDVKIATWNAQALFATKVTKQNSKRKIVDKLIEQTDILCIQETHGQPGTDLAWAPPSGIKAWWSHGSARRAGVAIWVKESFYKKFTTWSWEEWIPGRAARLSAQGPEGRLDIVVVYFTGNKDFSPPGWTAPRADKERSCEGLGRVMCD